MESLRDIRCALASCRLCVEFLARSESGAKATRTPNASRLPGVAGFREAFGVRRVHRRFTPLLLRRHDDVILFALAEQEVFAEKQIVGRHGARGAGFTDVFEINAAAFDILSCLTF